MSSFAQARADLAEAMAKLKTLDRVFALMSDLSARLEALGEHPVLSFDPGARALRLEVVIGRMPPQILVGLAAEVNAPALEPSAVEPVSQSAELAARGEPELRTAPTRAASAAQTATSANPVRPSQLRTGPWSEEEVDRAVELIGRGLTNKEIAAELGRTATGIHFRVDPLRRSIQEDAEREAQPRPDAPLSPAAPHASSEPVPDDTSRAPSGRLKLAQASLTMAERRVWEHLDAIADPVWPDCRDLELVQMLGGGYGAEDAAGRLELPKASVVARWNLLFPEKSIEAQSRMLSVLRARMAAEAT